MMVSNSERLSIELFESGAQYSALLLLLILFVGWNEERSLEAKLKKKKTIYTRRIDRSNFGFCCPRKEK
jgi:hypothetical protein